MGTSSIVCRPRVGVSLACTILCEPIYTPSPVTSLPPTRSCGKKCLMRSSVLSPPLLCLCVCRCVCLCVSVAVCLSLCVCLFVSFQPALRAISTRLFAFPRLTAFGASIRWCQMAVSQMAVCSVGSGYGHRPGFGNECKPALQKE